MSTLTTPPTARPPIPPLRPGDRLTAAEFERRWDAMPDLKNAELIDGIVYMAPPVSWDFHSTPHADVMAWLGIYRAATSGVRVGDNGSVRLDLNNMPQPDAVMVVEPAHGGQAHVGPDGYLTGAPELAIEVSASTSSHDLGLKLDLYRRFGAKEYVVWRTYDRAVDYFVLRGGRRPRYEPLPPDANGVVRSVTFPGLWLDVPRLIANDLAGVQRTLNLGLATPEYAAFVARLAAAAAK